MGVAATVQTYHSGTDMIEAADGALYVAKHNGRNRVKLAEDRTSPVTRYSQLSLPPGTKQQFSTQPILSPDELQSLREVPMSDKPAVPKEEHWAELPVFDCSTLEQLGELIDEGDSSFLTELFQTYLESAKENIVFIRTTGEEYNRDELRRAAHTLKGSSLNVGATQVATTAKELENDLRKGGVPDMNYWAGVLDKQVTLVSEGYAAAIEQLVS